jgi:hypothetical protein
MEKTNIYKLEKIGLYWHIMRLHYVGWWIFKSRVWLSEFPYYLYKEDADKAFKEITKNHEPK